MKTNGIQRNTLCCQSSPNIVKLASLVLIILLLHAFQAEAKGTAYRKKYRQHLSKPALSAEWHTWKSIHGKSYQSHREELNRHSVWQANKKFIEAHNAKNKTLGYTLAMNELGDLVSS